ISAFGPRGRSLTAKLGAHWITAMRGAQPAIAALAEMQKAWQAAGRDLKALYSTVFGGGCVLAEGEPADSARAKALAGPAAAIVFHNKAEEQELGSIGFPTPPQFKTKFDAYMVKSTASISRPMHATSLTTAAIHARGTCGWIAGDEDGGLQPVWNAYSHRA